MSDDTGDIALCVFSKAQEGLVEAGCLTRVAECPLHLNKAQAQHCRCRTRQNVGRRVADDNFIGDDWRELRVVTCLWPRDWKGRLLGPK